MDVKIHPSWKTQLAEEFEKPYFVKLTDFVRAQYGQKKVFPTPVNIFRAFELCPFEKVKVVILGQDPYHGVGQANGLCFSVNPGVTLPPSLQNIFKEIQEDVGGALRVEGCLDDWAEQGVLLLNATLTVEAHKAGSHQHKGWEEFTDAVVDVLSREKEHLVFILWGRYAQEKGAKIDTEKHCILKAAHPSPFSAYSGFFGSKPFSKTNEYLEWNDLEPVRWA
ncbi:uracil-DNA glycosylase [Candidatus Peregrinibacteria bacterium]|nr:MAG: uracil-DNA glycosylase [Candidatus Peregrinibacteria bacterium]